MYNDKLTAEEQINAEEMIAAHIFDYTEGLVEEEVCADLGRSILLRVLQQFRPDVLA